MKDEKVVNIEAAKAPVLKMQMATNEQTNILSNGEEMKAKTVTFSFNPDEVECVKTKSGDYVIRSKKK